ncbi:DUF6777 domain-containing protein [Streptomyces sp. NPDC048192]|uniref:DUF6777 domain-containing protein n=1 Tax=Streptomyces sp. NPDC048192 TaxID=3365510 RepID=UPI0037132A8E
MSAEPPSSGRPTGPPSGPLAGSSRPPSGPPPAGPPPSGPGGAGGPHVPWWKSVPRVAGITAVVVAAVVLAVVFTRPGGGSSAKGGEVFLQSADSSGEDPFTESTARQSSAPPPPSASAAPSGPANAVQGVDGGAPGLYGGTRSTPACDVGKQVRFFQSDPAKEKAFASVAGVQPSGVPAYLRSLTPVQLRVDTRVTNHGYRDGAPTSYQSVLQAGTAVLVDGHGVPRVRCACGNPLTPPVAQKTAPKPVGARWPAYRPSNVVVVVPAPKPVDVFVLYDTHHDDWIHRRRGDHDCRHDRPAPPPKAGHPWTAPPRAASPSCPPGTKHCPPPSGKPSPSASSSPSASKPSPSSPSPSHSSPSSGPSGSPAPSSPASSPASKSPATKPTPSPSSVSSASSAPSPSASTSAESKPASSQTSSAASPSSVSSAPAPVTSGTPGEPATTTPGGGRTA